MIIQVVFQLLDISLKLNKLYTLIFFLVKKLFLLYYSHVLKGDQWSFNVYYIFLSPVVTAAESSFLAYVGV